MGFLIGLFTVVMVLDCLVLILLVLIQLPKKEAGMGLAFGGAATDALFGAGSGNVLTKITKFRSELPGPDFAGADSASQERGRHGLGFRRCRDRRPVRRRVWQRLDQDHQI